MCSIPSVHTPVVLHLIFDLLKMSLFQGKVKSVLSGDTLILTNQKGIERTLSLAYISAPRLKREGDEVCLPYLPTAFPC